MLLRLIVNTWISQNVRRHVHELVAEAIRGGPAPTPPDGNSPDGKSPAAKTSDGRSPDGRTPDGKTADGKKTPGRAGANAGESNFVRQVVADVGERLDERLSERLGERLGVRIGEPLSGQAPEQTEGAGPDAEPLPPPPADIAVVFAMNLESAGFVEQLERPMTMRGANFTEHLGPLDQRQFAVVESGVGREAAARATEDVIALHRPAWVVSAGFAGALDDRAKRGDFIMPDTLVDETGERLSIGLKLAPQPRVHSGAMLTVDRIVREEAEKRRLGQQYDAIACDMETMAVAQVCRRLKTRFLAVRIVSDAVDDTLPPEVARLLNQKSLAGKLGAAAGALLNRPSSAKDMWNLHADALRAADRLAKFLVGVTRNLPT